MNKEDAINALLSALQGCHSYACLPRGVLACLDGFITLADCQNGGCVQRREALAFIVDMIKEVPHG